MRFDFLLDGEGNYSNSRLIADIMILQGLLMVDAFILIGVLKPETNLMAIATAVGVLFTSVAGTALGFLFLQKKEEGHQVNAKVIQTNVENKIEASIDKK